MQIPQTRKQMRLKKYDYSADGYYFVTLCTNNRQALFGTIENNQTVLNNAGEMIEFWWSEISIHFSGIALDQYTIMPNHIHGIIIVGADRCVRPKLNRMQNAYDTPMIKNNRISNNESFNDNDNTIYNDTFNNGRTHRSAPTISGIVQWFKTMTTNHYIKNVKNNNWLPFNKRLWQRSFHDHIIRNERSLNAIREYISHNPVNWEQDIDNLINL